MNKPTKPPNLIDDTLKQIYADIDKRLDEMAVPRIWVTPETAEERAQRHNDALIRNAEREAAERLQWQREEAIFLVGSEDYYGFHADRWFATEREADAWCEKHGGTWIPVMKGTNGPR